MKIGIVSDSHGRSDRLAEAVAQLAARGAEAVVHCGDITAAEDVEVLAGSDAPAWLVAGNMDRHEEAGLRQAAEACGVTFAIDFVAVPLGDGEHLAATHGHLQHLLDELVRGGQFRYVCHGHSHRRRDERLAEARVLNPGALWHPRGRRDCTCLLLDTHADRLEEISIR
ncbi:MAG: YfcE family phosphodiesterase [Planctomycetes bacterium]|jgi:putative phosphoesterase|nr:YfcE family phosphodiesterase [Phycisphaerae bacterium]NBB94491.1 YfcE family phosphodiesterase [Planctomycetota bacterium]